MPTSTVENYLKALYTERNAAQDESGNDMIPVGRLASAMGVVPGTATSMVKALADSGLVDYEPRTGVKLSAKGEQLALHVLRRHRLVELFLVDVLGLDWSDVHEEADALEHAVSDRVIERMDQLLGHPTTDPHGDPIPTSDGRVDEVRDAISLADCPIGVAHQVARVLDQEPMFLRFIDRHGLKPGATVTVQTRDEAGQAATVEVESEKDHNATVSLGLPVAAKILVLRSTQSAEPD